MRTILFITDLVAGTRVTTLAGVHGAASTLGWHVEEIELARLKSPLADAISYWQPLGLIVEGSGDVHAQSSDLRSLPVVWIDPPRAIRGGIRTDMLTNDNAAIADLAFRTLRTTDVTDFAFIGWTKDVTWSQQREHRFADRVREQGLSCAVLDDPWTLGNKADFATRLRPFLNGLPRPCGIFAVNDDIARVVIDFCKVDGYALPGDFFLIGVDDQPEICDMTCPSLTSIRPNFTRAGRRAVELLARRLAHPSAAPRRETYQPLGVTERLSTRRLARNDTRLPAALDLIRREACHGLKANDVVQAMGLSERLAEARFKDILGRHITEEITSVRLEHVFELLRNPHQAIGPIANLCGWGSEIYLKRLFKARTGRTMRAWRAAALREDCEHAARPR